MTENNYNKIIKCDICKKYKCKYYNSKIRYLSEEICNLCFGRKEICFNSKPELYKIVYCHYCINDDYTKHNFKCDLCSCNHVICLCIKKESIVNKNYFLPY